MADLDEGLSLGARGAIKRSNKRRGDDHVIVFRGGYARNFDDLGCLRHICADRRDRRGRRFAKAAEPDALVALNNRRKRAEIEIDREIRRILRDLSQRTARESDAIEAGIVAAGVIDAAFARAHYAEELDAVSPEVGQASVAECGADVVKDMVGEERTVVAAQTLGSSDIDEKA